MRLKTSMRCLRTVVTLAGIYTLSKACYEALQSPRMQKQLRRGRASVKAGERVWKRTHRTAERQGLLTAVLDLLI